MYEREDLHHNHMIVRKLRQMLEYDYHLPTRHIAISYSSNKFFIVDKRDGQESLLRFDPKEHYLSDIAKELNYRLKHTTPVYPTSRPDGYRPRSIFDSFADRKYVREREYDEMREREREREQERRLRERAREEEVHASWMRTKSRMESAGTVFEKWDRAGFLDPSDRSEKENENTNQVNGFEILPTFELNI